ncbi:MAG: leucine-rich repeat protein [Clostridia bacterium]|nr:leucine-rich repeat protein [Clostridia bacterium]
MKKKLTLFLVMVMALVCVFAVSVFADSVHANVDKTQTVTLSDGTVCNLFDSEGNALIWFKNGSELQSIRADDSRMVYTAGNYTFNVGNSTVGTKTAYEVTKIQIALESGTIDGGSIVVLNLMDDDVIINAGGNIGKPVNCVKTVAWANKVIEYAYLRLDTVAIQQQAFSGCTKLKYINLEDLTELRQIGGGQTFAQSTALFAGEVLDLRNTKLVTLPGNGAFSNVPFAGVKFPSTLTNISDWNLQYSGLVSIAFPENVVTINASQFLGCQNLQSIYIHKNTTTIKGSAFGVGNNKDLDSLEKIFFVGSKEELEALITNTDSGNNAAFFKVVGENNANLISYKDYLALEDKSGYYAVYDYSYCEAYNEGEHTTSGTNPCVGSCSVCALSFVQHSDAATILVKIEYTDFTKTGVKTHYCENEGCTYSSEETVPAIFVNNGYSYSGTAILQGFAVNSDALIAYEEANNTTVQYGLVVGSVAKLGATNTLFDGTTLKAGAFSVSFDDKRNYSVFEMQVTGLTADYQDTQLYVCAYVIDNGTVTYISNGANTSTVDPVTYKEIVAVEAGKTTGIIIPKEEENA